MSRFARITAALPDRCRAEASLAGLCTWHIGGPAALLVEPHTVAELETLLGQLEQDKQSE